MHCLFVCIVEVEDSEALENRRYMVEGERKFLLYDDTTQMTVEIDEVKYTPNHSHEHLKPYVGILLLLRSE